MARSSASLLVSAVSIPLASSWITQQIPCDSSLSSPSSSSLFRMHPLNTRCNMNLFSDIGDILTGGRLVTQTKLPFDPPLAEELFFEESRVFAIQERGISFTGEDFDVTDVSTGETCCRVRGAMLHLPGKDKMRLASSTTGHVLAVLDRKLIAINPTYDIYRGDSGEKLGWIEKAPIALTDTFEVFLESNKGFGPFHTAAYKLEGDFLDRLFVMKNEQGQVVAKVTQDSIIQFDAFNHYQVEVAAGMDPVLVIACACVIDEEFDEEHQKQREKKQSED